MSSRRIAAPALTVCIMAALCTPAEAQPEPSLRSSCAELRQAVATLDLDDEKLVTIQVVGALTAVQHDGALGYLAMCAPPEPQVLCVTYSIGDWKIGDRVTLTGTLSMPSPHHVLLDPCLHSPPE